MLQQAFRIKAKHSDAPDIRRHSPREDLANVCNHTRGNEPGGVFLTLGVRLALRDPYLPCLEYFGICCETPAYLLKFLILTRQCVLNPLIRYVPLGGC